jgi:hypothetical protein
MIKQFEVVHKAWYAESTGNTMPEINISIAEKENEGVVGEFTLKWVTLYHNEVMLLECFDDGFEVLAEVMPVLATMDKDLTCDQVTSILIGNDFIDVTCYGEQYEL